MVQDHPITFAGVLDRVVNDEVERLNDEHRDKLLRSLLHFVYQQADPDDFLSYALTYHAPALKGLGNQHLANM
jgi:hypothetical protein